MDNLEKNLDDYPSFVTLDKMKTIIYQLEHSVCKIKYEGINGTGFFCYIHDNINKKIIPVMITNNHIIDENYFSKYKELKISLNNEKKYIDIKFGSKSTKYTNKDNDITILEVKNDQDKMISFLDIDERIYESNSNKIFNKTSSYIIQYPNIKGASASFGLINRIEEDSQSFNHLCVTDEGSSGSPIINLESNKVIGVHVGASEKFKFNIGTFLKYPIYEFLNLYCENNSIMGNNNTLKNKNEIKITLKIEKTDINKEIYFLDNTNEYLEKNEISPHSKLSELNQSNTELFINEIQYKYQKFFIPPVEGNFDIKLKFNNYMKDCSYMFYYCRNIISIDCSCFQTHKVTNMSKMFSYCTNLNEIDLSNFNTENVTNMSYMFSYCGNLKKINLSSFNTKNINDMSFMFCCCNKLSYIDISSFVASPYLNNESMFDRCYKINKLKSNKKLDSRFYKSLEDKKCIEYK